MKVVRDGQQCILTSENQDERELITQLWIWWHTVTPVQYSAGEPAKTPASLVLKEIPDRDERVRRALCDFCQELCEPSICETKYRDECLVRDPFWKRLSKCPKVKA